MGKSKVGYWLTEEGLMLLAGWARRGLTDAEICQKIDLHVATLCEWKKKYPDIGEALKSGKEVADIIVENALFRKAIGYRVKEGSYKADNSGNLVPVSAVEKDIPPDTTAQIFWLKNRRPDLWRDRRKEAESDTQNGGVVVLPEVVAEVIKTIAPPPENNVSSGDENDK